MGQSIPTLSNNTAMELFSNSTWKPVREQKNSLTRIPFEVYAQDQPSSSPKSIIKVRDLFAINNNLKPKIFLGAQAHVFTKIGTPWETAYNLPPSNDNATDQLWSAISKLNWKSNTACLSAACDLQLPRVCCASVITEFNMKSGNWNFETVGRLLDGNLDLFLAGQVSAYKRLSSARFDIDYNTTSKSYSLYVNPVFKEIAFRYLQVNTITLYYSKLSVIVLFNFPFVFFFFYQIMQRLTSFMNKVSSISQLYNQAPPCKGAIDHFSSPCVV